MNMRSLSSLLWALLPVAACSSSDPTPSNPDGDLEGIEEAGQDLTDLSSECSFVSSSGTLTVALATGDVALVAKSTGGAITINGFACGGATGTTLKKLVVTGTAGAQTLIVDFMNGVFAPGITGAVGMDIDLGAGADAFKIRGSKAADTFVFGSTGITFNTDSLKDITVANVEAFTVTMSDGNDIFSGAGSAPTGGAAFPTAVTVYGGDGNDTITGGAGDDTFYGGNGADVFVATASDGNDVYNGDAGSDTVDYGSRSAAVTVTIDGVADDGGAGETDDVSTTIEVVKGGSAADSLTGSTGADTLYGGAGDDVITGGTGNDTLYGDAGNDTFDEGSATSGADTINGGAGVDTVSYASRSNAVTATIDGAANDGESGELDKIMTDVENLTGGSGGDTLTGSTAANVLDGGAGADTLSGGAGNDTLKGGAGNDTVNGDAGDDVFDEGTASSGDDALNGGAGVDTVDYSGRSNTVTLVMDGTTASGEAGESDVVGTDVENATGGAGDDDITGNAADNLLQGGAGDDTLAGLGGDDTVDGDAGNDTIDCGAGDADIMLDLDVAAATNCEL